MLEDGSLFKDFEVKKEERGKVEKGDIEIKIRFNKKFIERAIFVVIILILLVLVFYNPFCEYKYKSEADIIAIEKEKNESSKEIVIEEEPATEVEKTEKKEEPKTEESEKKLSGKITLEIGDIEIYENNTKVKSIVVKIDNQKKIFTPLLYIYWYDESTEDAVKLKPNGGKINITSPIPLGTIKQIKLDDELVNRRLRTDDPSKEIFKIELYDRNDETIVLDTKTKVINIG